MRLRVEPAVDHAVSLVGLASSIRADLAGGDQSWPVRKAAESMRAWEYAGSPAAFQIRGVYLHRDSLMNV
jgi:hypothetical protein